MHRARRAVRATALLGGSFLYTAPASSDAATPSRATAQTDTPTPKPTTTTTTSNAPFHDPNLDQEQTTRKKRQLRLMSYLAELAPRLRAAADAQNQPALDALRSEAAAKQEAILFDALPAERRRYMDAYGCAAWTDEALGVVSELAPIVEIGAGAGHWYRALAGRGVDITAYDDGSEVPMRAAAAEGVRHGSVEVLSEPENASRTLLLVYPPAGQMALRCVRAHRGETLLYVGEARGGYNADAAFFDELESRWRVKRVVELRPFPGGHERMYVLRRRHRWMRSVLGGG